MKTASALLRWIRHVLPGMMGDFSVSPTDGKARIYRGGVQVLEDQGNRGAANGYAPLGPSSLVAYGYLGTGGTGAGSKFLADDGTWKAGGGGGGTLDHAALTSNLAWTTSAHTGTASRFATFNGAGAAAELAMPSVGLVAWTGSAWAATTVDAPLGLSGGHLSITQADATHNGYLTSADWATFNGKQAGSANLTGLAALGDGLPVRNTTWGLASLTGLSLTGSNLAVLYGVGSGSACQGNDSRLSDARAPTGSAGGDLGGTYPNPTVSQARGLRETSGPTTLVMGAVADGQILKRSGSTIIGVNLIIAIAMNDLSAGQDVPIETGVSTVSNPAILIANGSDV